MTNNTITDDAQTSNSGIDRRHLLKMTGAGVAAIGAMSIFDTMNVEAQDMSNGAANFYASDKVTLQKVTFKPSIRRMSPAIFTFPGTWTRRRRTRRSSSAIRWAP